MPSMGEGAPPVMPLVQKDPYKGGQSLDDIIKKLDVPASKDVVGTTMPASNDASDEKKASEDLPAAMQMHMKGADELYASVKPLVKPPLDEEGEK